MARLSEPKRDGDRTFKGLNFFSRTEQALLRALHRPEFNIRGVRRAELIPFVANLMPRASRASSLVCAHSASSSASTHAYRYLPYTSGACRHRRGMFPDAVQYHPGLQHTLK